MSEKKISYLNRTFDDYKNALKDFSRKYYPDMAVDYSDASIGSWLIDLNADVADKASQIEALNAATDGALPRWEITMAGATMLMAPMLIAYIFANRQIKNAFVYSGIK